MTVEKTLLTCSFAESLPHIVSFKSAMDEWNAATGFFDSLKGDFTPDPEKSDDENAAARRAEFAERFNAALSSALINHAELTTRVICEFFFIPPEKIDDYSLADLFGPILETINNPRFMGFFMQFGRGL